MDEQQRVQFRNLSDRAGDAARRGDHHAALSYGNAMRKIAPDDPGGWFHSARAMRAIGDLESAENLLADAPGKFPNDMPVLFIWTSLPRASGDIDEAIRRASWLLNEFPNDPSPHTHLGRCLIAADRRAEARRVVLSALMRWPEDMGLNDTLKETGER